MLSAALRRLREHTMIVKPFRALRPAPELAARIPSVPYDVVTTDEARALARDEPHSFLHVIRPEIDLPPEVDAHDRRVYEKGRENFRAFVERGWLVRDTRPAYYVYRLEAGAHRQTGIVGAAAVQDYLDGKIKKHEHTRPDKEQDRVDLIEALSALPGPIFLTYRPDAELASAIAKAAAGEPAVRFTADDGVEHSLWVADEPRLVARIERRFAELPATYVADGHHRTAAAARVCAKRIAALRTKQGSEPCRFFLAVHFPSDELRVLDYNRAVRDLDGLDPAGLVAKLRAGGFDVMDAGGHKRPQRRGTFGMYLDGRWYSLVAPQSSAADAVARLDVSVLTRLVLEPLLAIGDPRTDARIDFVGGGRGVEELERRVDSGRAAVAFTLYPTALDEVMQVADEGRVMPPKSTWFDPKLRSGLVVQTLEGDTL